MLVSPPSPSIKQLFFKGTRYSYRTRSFGRFFFHHPPPRPPPKKRRSRSDSSNPTTLKRWGKALNWNAGLKCRWTSRTSRVDHSGNISGWRAPKVDGLEKVTPGPLWPTFLVSMFDFWGVYLYLVGGNSNISKKNSPWSLGFHDPMLTSAYCSNGLEKNHQLDFIFASWELTYPLPFQYFWVDDVPFVFRWDMWFSDRSLEGISSSHVSKKKLSPEYPDPSKAWRFWEPKHPCVIQVPSPFHCRVQSLILRVEANYLSHRIHAWYIYPHLPLKKQLTVGK